MKSFACSGIVTTIAGNGRAGFADGVGNEAMFNLPAHIAIDDNSNLSLTAGITEFD